MLLHRLKGGSTSGLSATDASGRTAAGDDDQRSIKGRGSPSFVRRYHAAGKFLQHIGKRVVVLRKA